MPKNEVKISKFEALRQSQKQAFDKVLKTTSIYYMLANNVCPKNSFPKKLLP